MIWKLSVTTWYLSSFLPSYIHRLPQISLRVLCALSLLCPCWCEVEEVVAKWHDNCKVLFNFFFLFSTPTFHIHPVWRVCCWEHPCLAANTVWQSSQVAFLTEVAQKLLLLPQCFFQLETWDWPKFVPIFLCPYVNLGDSVSSLKWVWWRLPQSCLTVPALFVPSRTKLSAQTTQHSQLLISVTQPCKWHLGQSFDVAAPAALSVLWLAVRGCKAPGSVVVEDFYFQYPSGSLSLCCWSPPQVISSIGSM